MVTDGDILQVLRCVQECGNDSSHDDIEAVFDSLEWDSDRVKTTLSEARRRTLVSGWKDYWRGTWHVHLEVTIQGERLLRSARPNASLRDRIPG